MKNNIYRKVIKSKYFVKSFWALFVVMTALLICLLGYMYSNMKNVLNDTFEKNNEQSLNIIANNIDDSVSRAKFLLNAIESNALTKNFFIRGSEGSELFSNQDLRMKEYFSAIEASNDFLESVCLYSEQHSAIFCSQGFFPADSYADNGFIEKLPHDGNEDIFWVSRPLNNLFPFVVSFIKPSYRNGKVRAVVVNVNLSKLYQSKNSDGEFYVVSDSGKIISERNQRSAEKDPAADKNLSRMDISDPESAFKRNEDGTMCVYNSYQSNAQGWRYVLVTPITNYDSLMMRNRILLCLIGITFILLSFFAAILLTVRSYKPIDEIMRVLKHNSQTNSFNEQNVNEVKYITSVIMENMQFNKTLSDELERNFAELTEARLDALKLQINPHFMFNTLNMIRYMEIVNLGYEHDVPKMTFKLCEILRYVFEREDIVSVKDEIDHLYKYIELMNLRYENKIKLHVDMDAKSADAKMPKLIFQPLVENSVIHGMKNNNAMNIRIQTEYIDRKENPVVRISVKDDGCGLSREQLEKINTYTTAADYHKADGIGLSNIIRRIKLTYREKASFDIKSENGTEIIIQIPYIL